MKMIIVNIITVNIITMNIIRMNMVTMNTNIFFHQIFFRDETSDKPKENRVVKFHDEAPERGRSAKKSMKVCDSSYGGNNNGEW